jgi:GNAT superfamily N-acetyltransferase
MKKTEIREATPSDREEISKLSRDTIIKFNSNDYNQEQIQVWSRQAAQESFWKNQFDMLWIWVANEPSSRACSDTKPILGFIELSPEGEIHCFYVHKEAQGQGVASQLMDFICDWAVGHGIYEIFANVSVTARPFFEKMEFEVVKTQVRELEGQAFRQFRMKRRLAEA